MLVRVSKIILYVVTSAFRTDRSELIIRLVEKIRSIIVARHLSSFRTGKPIYSFHDVSGFFQRIRKSVTGYPPDVQDDQHVLLPSILPRRPPTCYLSRLETFRGSVFCFLTTYSKSNLSRICLNVSLSNTSCLYVRIGRN